MAASTGPRPDLITNPTVTINYPVKGSTQIWQYEHCCVTNSGLLVPASDTSGLVYVGQASMSVNNTGADGAVTCPVQSPLINPHATFNATSPATSWIGAHVFFIDDNTVGLHGSTSNTICAGRCEAVVLTGTSGQVLVNRTDRYAPTTTT
jgi:hypothetical protein